MEIRKTPYDSALVLLNTYPEDSNSTNQKIHAPPDPCLLLHSLLQSRKRNSLDAHQQMSGWRQSWMYSGGVLYCQKERWNLEICRKLRGPRKHRIKKDKWKSRGLFHVWSPETISHESRCVGLWELRGTSWRREGSEGRVTEVHDTHICKG